jgi:Tfp pilus assembly protein PilE
MTQVKLSVVIFIALLAAIAGGTFSYFVIPNTDPEVKALLARQVQLAEEEAAARKEAAERREEFFSTQPTNEPEGGYRQMAPRFN